MAACGVEWQGRRDAALLDIAEQYEALAEVAD
jgi:hypothetical protein